MLSQFKNAHILIVDDTPKNIQLLGTVLKNVGYKIIVATNGLQALGILEKVKPDLILLDVMMPDLDGYETCKRIKESESLKDIPVIFLTAKTQPEDIVKGFQLGAADYIIKPFNSSELLARVKTHLEFKFNQELLQTLLNFQRDMVLMTDGEKIIAANYSFLEFANTKNVEEFNSKYPSIIDFLEFDPVSDNSYAGIKLQKLPKDEEFRIKINTIEGKNLIFRVKQNIIPEKGVSILSLTDITQLENQKTSLEEKASIDELTKVYNRTKFQQLFKNILEENKISPKSLCLVIFDIDHFKKINDTYGHNKGDEVLVNISSFIKGQIRMSDILCRWGGEEFTLLLVGSNLDDGVKICEKIRILVQNHPFIEDRQVTVSMGVTQYFPNDTLETFVDRADNALYRAKKAGRNRTEKN
ncbi:MAG: diguanylate cyclase [Leptospiraceae bacterium]|nr:diguanylate cyclase [Leptospiraceae bacterium]